jgi:tRNA threonylcarbamoyladenosine biosynthesis protein TsaE
MSRRLVVRTNSPEETLAVGRVLARCLRGGYTVSLEGPLGVGKTVVAAGLCAELGVEEPVTSPTFTLQNEYAGTDGRRIVHVDAFRLGGAAEFDDLGVLDRLEGDTVLIVEWGERVAEALRNVIRVEIAPEGDGEAGRAIAIHLPAGVDLDDPLPLGDA